MKIAVVSGINKLSIEICKSLGKKNVKSILVSPNHSHGSEMKSCLKMLGDNVEYRRTNGFSNFMGGMNRDFDRVDVLINTADTTLKSESKEHSHKIITGNFYDNLHLTRSLLPLIKKSESPRIVNVLGTINPVCCSQGSASSSLTPTIMEAFVSEAKTLSQLEFLVKDYLNDVDLGDYHAKGWPSSSYGMSRLALISLTKILAREEHPVLVNACNSTCLLGDLEEEKGGIMTVVESAVNPVILATELPNDGPTGKVFSDDMPVSW